MKLQGIGCLKRRGIFKCKERLSEAAACFRKALGKDFERLLGDEKISSSLDTNEHSSDTEEEDNSEDEEDPKEDEFVADSILSSVV